MTNRQSLLKHVFTVLCQTQHMRASVRYQYHVSLNVITVVSNCNLTAISYTVYEKEMDTQYNSKTLHGPLAITFCIFKHIGYHMSLAMKSG